MKHLITLIACLITVGLFMKAIRKSFESPVLPRETHQTTFVTTSEASRGSESGSSTSANSALIAASARPSAAPSARPARVLSAEEEREWRELIPTQDEVLSQVEVDPHGTPDVLKEMAPVFADLMEEAQASPENLLKAFRKFEICAEDPDMNYVTSLKAICFINAAKLSASDSSLKRDLSHLRDKLDPSTKRLVDSLETL